MAKTQNSNYIEIMNHSVRDRNEIFNTNNWESEDILTNNLITQFRSGSKLTMLNDTISKADIQSPTIYSYLYLLSKNDLNAEISFLNELYLYNNYNIDHYLNTRYLDAALHDVEEGDYYSAQRLLKRYFALHDQFCSNKTICTDNNYYYLMRLLLQDRWALSCNRENATYLFEQIDQLLYDKDLINVANPNPDIQLFNEYITYLDGINLIREKNYRAAFSHYCDNIETASTDLFKEYNAFMAIRCAFWIFDKDRTELNKENFIQAKKSYYQYIQSKYLTIDVEYYNKIVMGSQIVNI